MDNIKEKAKLLIREKKKLKAQETKYNAQKKLVAELADTMMDLMVASGTTSYKNNQASLVISSSNVPNVDDWPKFYKFILKNKAFDLLQRRPAAGAWRDRIEGGEKIPGVSSFIKKTLRITIS